MHKAWSRGSPTLSSNISSPTQPSHRACLTIATSLLRMRRRQTASRRSRRESSLQIPHDFDMVAGAGAGVQLVYEHVRHSVLYLFWAAVYLYLIFVQQPITYFVVSAADWAWFRLPCNGFRDRLVRALKASLKLISPELATQYFSPMAFGEYLGSDVFLKPGEKKQLPLHSVSLQGCAWMLPYHIGVCEVLKREKVVDDKTIWLGSSGGALIAAAAALGIDLEYQLKACISMGIQSIEQHLLGPIGKMSEYIGPHVLRSLPEDAHEKVQGRLRISVTETPQGSKFWGNALVGTFKSRQHVYNMLMASTYIPVYYEVPVRPGRGGFYWDGGFSNNQPVLKHPETGRVVTTTVSPVAQKADISPKTQKTCNIEHLIPNDFEGAMDIYERGKSDANDYVAALLRQSDDNSRSATIIAKNDT